MESHSSVVNKSALNSMTDAERYRLAVRRLLAHHGSAHVKKSQADLQDKLPESEFLARSYFTDYRASHGDMTTSGMAASADGTFFNLPPAEADARSYSLAIDDYLEPSYHDPQANKCLQTPLQKRRTPSLDEIIRETWELHSLHRTGLAASSNVTGNRKVCILPAEDWGKARQNSIMPESKWSFWDKPMLQEETLPDNSWDMATKSEHFDITGSWMEPSGPPSKRKRAMERSGPPSKRKRANSINKRKELSQNDLEQEHRSSDLQRLTSARVAVFMDFSEDDDSNSDDNCENSDDDMPKITMDSSGDSKSREEAAFDFFFQVFVESEELKKLFSEQCHVGRFDCLVCSSIPGKPVKKYNGLVSLIMHASKVLKTKKKQEHRGYARALCAAMGWDLCRLPAMPGSSSPNPRCCIPMDEQEAGAQLCF